MQTNDEQELERAWAYLVLARTPGLGPRRMAGLQAAFGPATAVVAAGQSGAWAGLGEGFGLLAGALDPLAAERELTWGRKRGWRLCVPGSAGYPVHWADEEARWPPAFWVRGQWPEAMWQGEAAAVAVVGPRRASQMARAFAAEVAERAAWAGAWVVSGLAFGVDVAAHGAAASAQRAGAPAGTVAVLAGGVDRPSPTAHLRLADELLAAGGALWSAAPLGSAPPAGGFPVRNRWIAGLSAAVAVIEAGAQSGALHTAKAAVEMGRELLVTPARPWDVHAAGCLALLRDGATPLIAADDLWQAVPSGRLRAVGPAQAGGVRAPSPWAEHLAVAPASAEALAGQLHRPFHQVLASLEEGVVRGWARRAGGGRYALVHDAVVEVAASPSEAGSRDLLP